MFKLLDFEVSLYVKVRNRTLSMFTILPNLSSCANTAKALTLSSNDSIEQGEGSAYKDKAMSAA